MTPTVTMMQSSLKEEFSVDLEMPFGEPSLMPFANIGGSLKTGDELDLMLGCIDNDTEVVQDDKLMTPPIDTKYILVHRSSLVVITRARQLLRWATVWP